LEGLRISVFIFQCDIALAIDVELVIAVIKSLTLWFKLDFATAFSGRSLKGII